MFYKRNLRYLKKIEALNNDKKDSMNGTSVVDVINKFTKVRANTDLLYSQNTLKHDKGLFEDGVDLSDVGQLIAMNNSNNLTKAIGGRNNIKEAERFYTVANTYLTNRNDLLGLRKRKKRKDTNIIPSLRSSLAYNGDVFLQCNGVVKDYKELEVGDYIARNKDSGYLVKYDIGDTLTNLDMIVFQVVRKTGNIEKGMLVVKFLNYYTI